MLSSFVVLKGLKAEFCSWVFRPGRLTWSDSLLKKEKPTFLLEISLGTLRWKLSEREIQSEKMRESGFVYVRPWIGGILSQGKNTALY